MKGWCKLWNASINKINIVMNKIKEMKTKKDMIYRELMRYSQSLNVSIRKLFKNELKKRFTKYFKNKQDIKARVNRRSDQVGAEVWYDYKLSFVINRKSLKKLELLKRLIKMKARYLSILFQYLNDCQDMIEQVEKLEVNKIKKWKMQRLIIIAIN